MHIYQLNDGNQEHAGSFTDRKHILPTLQLTYGNFPNVVIQERQMYYTVEYDKLRGRKKETFSVSRLEVFEAPVHL